MDLDKLEALLAEATPGARIPHFRYKPGEPWEGVDMEADDRGWVAKYDMRDDLRRIVVDLLSKEGE